MIPGGRENLLYAVDTITDTDGDPVLVELEATEPALYFGCAPGSAPVFAAAVQAWLARA